MKGEGEEMEKRGWREGERRRDKRVKGEEEGRKTALLCPPPPQKKKCGHSDISCSTKRGASV